MKPLPGAMLVAAVVAAHILGVIVAGATPSSPEATPAASPVALPTASDGCGELAPYFAQASALINANAGLAIMQEVGHDVLRLTDDDAATVVEELDALIAGLGGIAVPEPARAWQVAYLDLLRWYRDMAASRDPIALQRIINNDRRLFVNLSTAILGGQSACPGTWTDAWNEAFGE